MKMNRFYLFLLLAFPINDSTVYAQGIYGIYVSTANIEIFKQVDGIHIPLPDQLEVVAGTNLTLICKTSSWGKVSWGWERENVQVKNADDLKVVNRKLYKLRYKNSLTNYAMKKLLPVFPQDSGFYVCLDVYHQKFKTIELNVVVKTDPGNLRNYLQALNRSQAELNLNVHKTRVKIPKFLCNNEMFTCNSGMSCIDYKYVCDGKNDCGDNSDENWYFCGSSPCSEKKQCRDGRCCCDKDPDLNCLEGFEISCCVDEDVGRNNDEPQIRIPYQFQGQLTPSGMISSYSTDSDYIDDSLSLGSVITMTIFLIIIVALVVLGIIFRKRLLSAVRKIRTGSLPPNGLVPSAAAAPAAAVSCTPLVAPVASPEPQLLSNDNLNRNKLPSYDEAVSGTQPSAPLMEKFMP